VWASARIHAAEGASIDPVRPHQASVQLRGSSNRWFAASTGFGAMQLRDRRVRLFDIASRSPSGKGVMTTK
jgi:hypothetical protein